jgi:hypothetical protein
MHRKQHHHRTWNWADENTPHEDMVVGAVDAVCSRMEDRAYQGGAMTYGEIRGFVKSGEFKGTDRQRHYIEMVMGEMKLLAQPEVGLIDSLHSFPNIGLPEPMYNRMVEKVGETVLILRERNYLI